MALWLDELATYAQTNSIGTIGTNLFRFQLQDGPGIPDAQVALIPYGGGAAQPNFGSDVIKLGIPALPSRDTRGERRTAGGVSEGGRRVPGVRADSGRVVERDVLAHRDVLTAAVLSGLRHE